MKLIILTLFFLFFGVNPVFAASVEPPTNVDPEIQINQSYSFNTSLTGVQSGEVYFVKCRIGPSSSSLTEGQTYNSTIDTWLSDTGSWVDMPTVTATDSSINFSIQCRIKSNSTEGQKIIYTRACLKKSDGTCGTSFQSSSGIIFTAVAQSSSTPTPSPASSSTSTPTPSPSSTLSTSSFNISNVPSQINSDQSFSVSVNLLSPNSPNTKFYLKGAFKKANSTNYFGITKVSGSWVKNGSTYSEQYAITTDASGNWSGSLEVMPDASDLGYTGTDDYIFKVGKYDSSASNPSVSWSNETSVNIVGSQSSQETTSTSSTNPTPITTPKTTISPKSNSSKISASSPSIKIGSVAGIFKSATPASSPTSQALVKDQKQVNIFVLAGIVLIIVGISSVGYLYFKKKHETI